MQFTFLLCLGNLDMDIHNNQMSISIDDDIILLKTRDYQREDKVVFRYNRLDLPMRQREVWPAKLAFQLPFLNNNKNYIF